MASRQTPERTRASAGGGSKRQTAFNKFMHKELARLVKAHPEMSHQERFKLATASWKTQAGASSG